MKRVVPQAAIRGEPDREALGAVGRMFHRLDVGCAVLAMLVAIVHCAHNPIHPIPDGIYLDPTGEQSIRVEGTRLRFRIFVSHGGSRRLVDRSYDYNAYEGGEIIPGPMASVEAVYGVGWYLWHWDGESIVQRMPPTDGDGDVVTFRRTGPPGAR